MTCAAAFALVEDLEYYAAGLARAGLGGLAQVAFTRGVLTPFAHPLFSVWMGLAVGWVMARRPSAGRAVAVVAGALGVSIASHAAWNGNAVLLGEGDSPAGAAVVVGGFVALFVSVTALILVLRRRQDREFAQQLGPLALSLSLDPAEVAWLGSARAYMRHRRALRGPARAVAARLRWTLHALAGAASRGDEVRAAELRDDVAELRATLRRQLAGPVPSPATG